MPPKSTTTPAATASSQEGRINTNLHVPVNPSQLRESYVPASDTSSEGPMDHDTPEVNATDWAPPPGEDRTAHIPPSSHEVPSQQGHDESFPGFEPIPTARTRLLTQQNWDAASGCGSENCNHGTFSPRPGTTRSYGSFMSEVSRDAFASRFPPQSPDESFEGRDGILGGETGNGAGDGDDGRKSQSAMKRFFTGRGWLSHRQRMYIQYYIPIFNWIPQYKWAYLQGDLIAALTMASFYIPMSLSYASNLGHIPPVQGLYSFVFNPLIYAIMGTCPQMVVGPEAAGSLLTGEVVRENIKKRSTEDDDGAENAEIAGIVTCMAGAFILMAGIFRLGFLDSVLSRPFLRGFISAIGVVIFVDQLIPEMGLSDLAAEVGGVLHGSSIDKLAFLVRNAGQAHALTCAVSFGAFAIIMVAREVKKRLQPRYPSVAYIPDRFLVVVLSAIFAWKYDWESQGLEILGNVKADGNIFRVHFPLDVSHVKYLPDAFSTAFVIALLGFFESSVAAKSIGVGSKQGDGIRNIPLSANRELVALGVANVTGGLFMALPAFGGYGRSKVNASTGGKTPMSSIFLSLITIFSVVFLLPYFYFLPKSVLCAMISVVAYSLVEEAPHDIGFFWRIRGWSELSLMFLIFATTIFWDLRHGIAVGIGLSVLRVVRHSTRPRIQILGRVPGTERFENPEANPDRLEFIEGCLIVKIPEPLTFANTGDLRNRLQRLEDHGTAAAHPALRRSRQEDHNKNIIFDVHGVTSLDGSGAQVLSEIIESYIDRGVRVFFCRVPHGRHDVWRLFNASGIVDMCGGPRHFVSSVGEALRMTELERLSDVMGESSAA